MPTKPQPRRALAGALYVIAATLLWSAIPICVKMTIGSVDAYTQCWVRFVVGSIILFAISLARGYDLRLKKRDFAMVLVAALGIGLDYIAYIRGIQSTTASASNVVVQFEVISIVILSYFWLKERMSRAKIVGMLITFPGVFLALWNGQGLADLLSSEYFFGNMLIMIAAPLWAVYGIAQKILCDRGVSVCTSLAYIFGFASIITFPAVALAADIHWPFSTSVWVALVTLTVPSTVGAYLMMGRGFRLLNASTASMITCLLPIFTIISAWVFLGERPSPAVLAGAALVVVGIIVIGRDEARSTSRSEAPTL